MEIKSKNELGFVIQADRMMNRGRFKWSFQDRLKQLFLPDYIMSFLVAMRKLSYYSHSRNSLLSYYWRMKYQQLSLRLGFSIGCNTLGYGVTIPHWGTIVIGASNRIGNYAVLHTSICIQDNEKWIGDALYLSTGVKMTTKLTLGDNISIGANSLVNKSVGGGNFMIAGMPAKIIKEAPAWYIRDGETYKRRVEAIERLKKEMHI